MIGLTHKQRDCLSFIRSYTDEHGACPSFQQMADALDLGSKGAVSRLILALEERGHIRRLPGKVRALEVLSPLACVPTAELQAELRSRGIQIAC